MAKAKKATKGKKATKAKKSPKAKKPRSAAQKAATAKMLAANKRRGKARGVARKVAAKVGGAVRAAREGGEKRDARVTKLEREVRELKGTVQNHGEVLGVLVTTVEAHDARLDAVEAAFGMASGRSGAGQRTVQMPAYTGAN